MNAVDRIITRLTESASISWPDSGIPSRWSSIYPYLEQVKSRAESSGKISGNWVVDVDSIRISWTYFFPAPHPQTIFMILKKISENDPVMDLAFSGNLLQEPEPDTLSVIGLWSDRSTFTVKFHP